MFDELRRNNCTYLLDTMIKEIKDMWFLLILVIGNWQTTGKWLLLAGIVISVISVFIMFISTRFCIDGRNFIYKNGIINKRSIEIPFDKITTIDVKISIIDRIFNTCSLKIDTGVAKFKGEEIKIKLKYEEAELIKKEIINNKQESKTDSIENKREVQYKKEITMKEILIYSLTSGKIWWAIGGFFVIVQFIQELEETLQIALAEKVDGYIDVESIAAEQFTTIMLWGIGILILVCVLVNIFFIIYQNIRLYGYTITWNGKELFISYGLISKKQYTISSDKINAIRYKQSVLQQILGLFTIEAITIGYGDEQNEKALIYPIANKKLLNEILGKLMNSDNENIRVNKPPKNAISFFIIKRNIILILILLPIIIIDTFIALEIEILLSVIFIIFNSILGYINYKNTSISVNKEILITSVGSLNRVTTIINQNAVQSVGFKVSPFQKRKNVYTFVVDIYSNQFGEVVTVRHINKEVKDDLYSNIVV